MTAARFQVVSLPRDRSSATVEEQGGSSDDAVPRRRFTWRFLAANNRSLAAATDYFADAAACFAAIQELKWGLKTAECELTRDPDGLWRWVVRSERAIAASTHRYPRQLRARMTCETFFQLASEPEALANIHVVYR